MTLLPVAPETLDAFMFPLHGSHASKIKDARLLILGHFRKTNTHPSLRRLVLPIENSGIRCIQSSQLGKFECLMVKKEQSRYASSTKHKSWQSCTTTQEKQDATNICQIGVAPDVEELRRSNCWRLWKERGLSVDEISFCLRMQPETVVNNIFSCARKVENVNWCDLCKLIKLTPDMAESILVGRTRAKMKLSSSNATSNLSLNDIRKSCPRNVTNLHITLVHAMLGRGLSASEILQISKLAAAGFNTVPADGGANKKSVSLSVPDWCIQQENSSNGTKEVLINKFFSATDNCNDGNVIAEVPGSSSGSKEASECLNASCTKEVTMFGILQWLQKTDGATLSDIAQAFEGYDEIQLMRSLLELLENSVIVRSQGKFRVPSKNCPGMQTDDSPPKD